MSSPRYRGSRFDRADDRQESQPQIPSFGSPTKFNDGGRGKYQNIAQMTIRKRAHDEVSGGGESAPMMSTLERDRAKRDEAGGGGMQFNRLQQGRGRVFRGGAGANRNISYGGPRGRGNVAGAFGRMEPKSGDTDDSSQPHERFGGWKEEALPYGVTRNDVYRPTPINQLESSKPIDNQPGGEGEGSDDEEDDSAAVPFAMAGGLVGRLKELLETYGEEDQPQQPTPSSNQAGRYGGGFDRGPRNNQGWPSQSGHGHDRGRGSYFQPDPRFEPPQQQDNYVNYDQEETDEGQQDSRRNAWRNKYAGASDSFDQGAVGSAPEPDRTRPIFESKTQAASNIPQQFGFSPRGGPGGPPPRGPRFSADRPRFDGPRGAGFPRPGEPRGGRGPGFRTRGPPPPATNGAPRQPFFGITNSNSSNFEVNPWADALVKGEFDELVPVPDSGPKRRKWGGGNARKGFEEESDPEEAWLREELALDPHLTSNEAFRHNLKMLRAHPTIAALTGVAEVLATASIRRYQTLEDADIATLRAALMLYAVDNGNAEPLLGLFARFLSQENLAVVDTSYKSAPACPENLAKGRLLLPRFVDDSSATGSNNEPIAVFGPRRSMSGPNPRFPSGPSNAQMRPGADSWGPQGHQQPNSNMTYNWFAGGSAPPPQYLPPPPHYAGSQPMAQGGNPTAPPSWSNQSSGHTYPSGASQDQPGAPANPNMAYGWPAAAMATTAPLPQYPPLPQQQYGGTQTTQAGAASGTAAAQPSAWSAIRSEPSASQSAAGNTTYTAAVAGQDQQQQSASSQAYAPYPQSYQSYPPQPPGGQGAASQQTTGPTEAQLWADYHKQYAIWYAGYVQYQSQVAAGVAATPPAAPAQPSWAATSSNQQQQTVPFSTPQQYGAQYGPPSTTPPAPGTVGKDPWMKSWREVHAHQARMKPPPPPPQDAYKTPESGTYYYTPPTAGGSTGGYNATAS